MIEHSVSRAGVELLTIQARYPRFIHSEVMTHRVFSRNAASSRAIPVAKMLEQVRNEPAMPVHWGKNQRGMQAREELTGEDLEAVKAEWLLAAQSASEHAEAMMVRGAHKQVANRILEPFQFMQTIITATETDNFYELRDHEDADPNFQLLARMFREAHRASKPVLRDNSPLDADCWHLPYVTPEERRAHRGNPRYLAQLSAARCARVSYLTHEGKEPDPVKDIELYDRLVGSRPLHASPVEHQAYPFPKEMGLEWSGNFRGWKQHRKLVEAEVWK